MSPGRTLSVILRLSGTGISENDLKSWGELFLASLTKDADLPLRHEHRGLRPLLNSSFA
jgi:hypothetical protein